MPRHLVVVLVAALALFVAACGDDDDGGGESVAVGDYANDICTAFTEWIDEIQAQQNDLETELDQDSTPEEGKEALRGFFTDAVDASEQLVQQVEDAGVPDTENGQEAADALQEAAEGARSELEESLADVEDLPTESDKAFADAADKFGDEAKAALQAVGAGLQQVNAPDLDKAFDEEPACQTS